MTMRELALAAAAITAAVTCATSAHAQVYHYGSGHDYTAERQATVDASGARRAVVDASAGSLRIEGRPGLTEVRAHGTAWSSSQRFLDQVKLTARRTGDVVEVEVDIPDHDGEWEDVQAGLDLVVEVPQGLALDVEDGSGSMEIRNVGGVEIHDGSGDIEVEHAGGDVRVEDGSGGIRLTDVKGSVEIPRDGSGSIDIRGVTGRVHVSSKGSGSIDVDDVGGGLEVDHKGSGSISYRNVRGTVSVPERRRRHY
jgi:hypothetical protein